MKKLIFTLGATAIFSLAAEAQFLPASDGTVSYTHDRVGIGTSVPSSAYKLEINGGLNLQKYGNASTALSIRGDQAIWYNGSYFSWGYGGQYNYFRDEIGINRTDPREELDVNGTTRTNDLKVNTSNGFGTITVAPLSSDKAALYFQTADKPSIMFDYNKDFIITSYNGSQNSTFDLLTIDQYRTTVEQDLKVRGESTFGYVGASSSKEGVINIGSTSQDLSGLHFMDNNAAGNIMFKGNGKLSIGTLEHSATQGGGVDYYSEKVIINRGSMFIDVALGINTTNPSDFGDGYQLAVNGKIRSKGLTIEDINWADFVFEDNYKLRSLTEVENYINENGHLPEIPSAEEVEENGVDVAEIQTKLLQKIEELTLYIIELEKKVNVLEDEK